MVNFFHISQAITHHQTFVTLRLRFKGQRNVVGVNTVFTAEL